jgi:hypothetical protein
VASAASKPPKFALIRKIALSFPQAQEVTYKGTPWFNIGTKTFALCATDNRWIFKLPHHQEMMLFDTRPEIFAPMRAGRLLWSYVEVERLDTAELRDLLEAAWRMVAPKALQKAYDTGRAPSGTRRAMREPERR